MVGAYHELSKEPNNATFFESSLKFMGERLIGKSPGTSIPVKPFGQFKHESIRYYSPRPTFKKKRVWLMILIAAYLLIGLILALIRSKKRLFITWPKMILTKK